MQKLEVIWVKIKKRSSPHFDVIFVEILGGVPSKQMNIDLASCKISRRLHLETFRGPQNLLMRPAKRGLCSPALHIFGT